MALVHAAFLRHGWQSYVLILLLQLRLLWRMWDFKDITGGDTSAYFYFSNYWFDSFRVNIAWSPLYEAFYGSFLFITRDPYLATILHRLVLILLISTLTLLLLRSILSPGLALLGAVWWTVVPTYYNNLYEVHLFALLPILLAWTLILRWDTPWARGTAVAVLAASTILVRNEFVIAAALMALMCLLYECYQNGRALLTKREILAYGIPLACAALLCVVAYWRSTTHFPELSAALKEKHTVNMSQVFAFGFQQRNSAWAGNPWFDGQSLMQETFGKGLPSFGEMLRANPAAVMEHLLWNLRLIPNGLQLLLFGAMFGGFDPDYVPVVQASYPMLLLAILVAVPLAAALTARHNFRQRLTEWIRKRMRLVIAFLPMLPVALVVALVERPRPSYLFYVTIIVIVLFMESVSVLLKGRPRWARAIDLFALLLPLALIVLIPSYYIKHPSTRPLKQTIERLAPQRKALASAKGPILLGDYATDAALYLRLALTTRDPIVSRPAALDNSVLQQWDRSVPLEQWLANQQIQFAYFDPQTLRQLRNTPSAMPLLKDPASRGWKLLACENQGDNSWIFLSKERQ